MTRNLKTYIDPDKAFAIANQWSIVEKSYKTIFLGRVITSVVIASERDQPQYLGVHYRDGKFTGVQNIDLAGNLLDEPKPERMIPTRFESKE